MTEKSDRLSVEKSKNRDHLFYNLFKDLTRVLEILEDLL